MLLMAKLARCHLIVWRKLTVCRLLTNVLKWETFSLNHCRSRKKYAELQWTNAACLFAQSIHRKHNDTTMAIVLKVDLMEFAIAMATDRTCSTSIGQGKHSIFLMTTWWIERIDEKDSHSSAAQKLGSFFFVRMCMCLPVPREISIFSAVPRLAYWAGSASDPSFTHCILHLPWVIHWIWKRFLAKRGAQEKEVPYARITAPSQRLHSFYATCVRTIWGETQRN